MITIIEVKRKLNEFRDLISDDDIDSSAIKLLMYVRDFDETQKHIDDAIVHCANYKRISKQIRKNVISSDEADIKINKLMYQMLETITNVEKSLMSSLEA